MGRLFPLSWVFACVLLPPAQGDITVGGNRPVPVFVPQSYDPSAPTPLILLLHGYGFSGSGMESAMGWKALAEAEGFLFASPDGTPDGCGARFWNATEACCRNLCAGANVDDSSYLLGLIDEVKSQLNVDPRRVHFAGWSNGGFMSYRMACDHADVIAAIASFAGATFLDPASCKPLVPVHVLQVQGTADGVIQYCGGALGGGQYPGAVSTVQQWATYDGCALTPEKGGALDLFASLTGAETQVTRYVDGCGSGGSAELWTVANGAHDVFLNSPRFSEAVVKYLLAHPRGPVPQASFSAASASGPVPLETALDGSESRSPEGTEITAYRWDFGDGATAEGPSPTVTHTYETPGRFPVTLTIRTSDEGRTDRSSGVVSALCPREDVSPCTAADVGGPLYPGSARFAAPGASGDLQLCAGGYSLGGTGDDQCFFVHRELRGDFSLSVAIAEVAHGKAGAEVGVMFRESLEPRARFAAQLFRTRSPGPAPGGRLYFRARGARLVVRLGAGAQSSDVTIRIERRGNVFTVSSSLAGEPWTSLEIPGLPETLLAGIVAVGTDGPVSAPAYEPLKAHLSGLLAGPISPLANYIRGDANADGLPDLSDAIHVLGHLFLGEPLTLSCRESADFNDDGGIDISDPVAFLSYLFLGKPARPVEPFPSCGNDPTPDDLGCESHRGCPQGAAG